MARGQRAWNCLYQEQRARNEETTNPGAPSLPASRAKGAARHIQGRAGCLFLSLSLLERELLLLCLVLGLPVQAELPQITLGVCFQCGVEDEAAVPSQESRNWFHLLSWDAHRSFIHIRMVGLEPSQLQTGPAGARTRRVSISSSHGYIMVRELLFEALGFFYSS